MARAFRRFDDASLVVAGLAEIPGRGIEGRIDGCLWRLGRPEFVAALRDEAAEAGEDGLVLGDATGIAARFELRERIARDAVLALERLRALGLEIVLASGDRAEAVRQVAAALGIETHESRMDPHRKVALVRDRQSRGERLLMVGDGINDGPVLAAADVSCAMGQGTAVAQSAADLLLLGESLLALPGAVEVARRTLRVMRQNLRWALSYNLGAVPLAALHLIAPWAAAIGMSASSLLVVLNAGRLARTELPAREARSPAPQAAPEVTA
jgi:Cu2+-exporting ATPase